MQAYSHFLWAIIISRLVDDYQFLIIFFSHYIIDALAIVTYHPAHRPLKTADDPNWLVYHIFTLIFSCLIFLSFMRECFLALIISVLVDIHDWGIKRSLHYFYPNLKYTFSLHFPVKIIRELFLYKLPDYSNDIAGSFIEITLAIVLLFLIINI